MSIFKTVGPIHYEGSQSDNPLAFKHYNPDETVGDRKMKDHLRFAVAYWHTFTGDGSDPFGRGTMRRPWDRYSGMDLAKKRVEAAFEFFEKLGVPFFCFHDRDIAPEGDTLRETNRNLDEIVDMIQSFMKTTGVRLLWNTAQLFHHPRYVHGAATAGNADVFAYAAAQVKKGLETAKELGGENYVFWGGREGYDTLLNTDMALELDNLARFYHMAVDYAKEIGFDGQLLIEPKPQEPTKHQYDYDVANTHAFLQKYDLLDHFKINIEANHATLAGHEFQHELRYARIHDLLGSVDANQGDTLVGWDTDEFPTNLYSTTLAMYEILKMGGFRSGGLNFDAKVRRGSFEPEDLFYAHIAGMDSFARGLKVAYRLIEDRVLDRFMEEKYNSFTQGIGRDIRSGQTDLKELEAYILDKKEIQSRSGRQEYLHSVLNQYLLNV
ncbi:xylose isomerase [Paludifilum halophilum]|uniref:Xylose isomerase n=1 Tax=Paludifilum halophilum TaxID=1642702 RepID=A0A235BB38_9BACL|nr:xylose isomerase [Paludifilum halophilum]OYD08785.1 xylose isomerase [Paludifilum halophilum]